MPLWCAPLICNLQKPSMLSKKYFKRCLGKSFDFKRIFFSLVCSGISAQLKTYAWIISNGKIRSFQQMTMKNFIWMSPDIHFIDLELQLFYIFIAYSTDTVFSYLLLQINCSFTYYGKFYNYEISQWVNLHVCYDKQ